LNKTAEKFLPFSKITKSAGNEWSIQQLMRMNFNPTHLIL